MLNGKEINDLANMFIIQRHLALQFLVVDEANHSNKETINAVCDRFAKALARYCKEHADNFNLDAFLEYVGVKK